VQIIDDMDTQPLNLGMIAAYYYINYTTIEVFSMSLTAKTRVRALLEIIASASEFDSMPIRHKEDIVLKQVIAVIPCAYSNHVCSSPNVCRTSRSQASTRTRASRSICSSRRT